MNKFVIVSFALLGWVFWELSGGSDFEPKTRTQLAENAAPQKEDAPIVARSALSVPIIKASAAADLTEGAATPAVISVTQTAEREVQAAPVVVASLATGLSTFATPGTPVFSGPSATDADVEDAVSVALQAAEAQDLRRVRGSRVNLRGGPGTSYSVLTVLPRDHEVEVLREDDTGWVKLRDTDSGRIGWMAAKMLTAKDVQTN